LLINIFLADLDLHTAIQNHLEISRHGRALLEVFFERRNYNYYPFCYPFSANLGPHEDDFLTYACFPGCGCDCIPFEYRLDVRRCSYFHLTCTNEIRFFNPLSESFPGNLFPGHNFSEEFVKAVFGQGIAPGKLAVEHSLFLYALAKTQISLREILSKVGVRTYHYHQLHLLAQRLVSVVPVPLRLVYNLFPGLYAPHHFPRRLGFFDSSQSLVFGIKEYIADLPPLLVYNGIFESREDFWFALGVILIYNYLPVECRASELSPFLPDVDPHFDNCDALATYYYEFNSLIRPIILIQLEGEYYRQKKLRFLVLLFKLFLTRGDLFL